MTKGVVYGLHAVRALLNNPARHVLTLWVQSGSTERYEALIRAAKERNIPIQQATHQQLTQRFGDVVHQGVIAEGSPLKPLHEADLPNILNNLQKPAFFLILDGLTDPHNLGACLRTADAAGVHAVIIPKDKSVGLNPTVSKVACGAMESVPIITVTNLSRTLSLLQSAGVWIYGAAGEAEKSLWQIDFTGSIALVLGSEGTGLRRLTKEHCDELFSIPMSGHVESLNVSVATGVSLFEVVRQKQM